MGEPVSEPVTVVRVEPVPPLFVTVKDAALRVGVKPYVVYDLARTGQVESKLVGKRRLINLESLDTWAHSLPSGADEETAS